MHAVPGKPLSTYLRRFETMRGIMYIAVSLLAGLLQVKKLPAQETDVRKELERAKSAIKSNGDEGPDYNKAGLLLEKVVAKDSSNAEAWYFLGYAIDKTILPDGESITRLPLSYMIRASEAFEKCIRLSNGVYKGELILLDPHTKLLTLWGAQALQYLYYNKRDSAYWCFTQAQQRGALNRTVITYFRQVLEECARNAYLFTSGDMYLYYLLYLQLVEKYRTDVLCIDLNLLNAKWYPAWLVKRKLIKTSYAPANLDKLGTWKEENMPLYILNSNGMDTIISWKFPAGSGKKNLLRSDRILLDILQQNAFEKDVFFPGDVPSGQLLFLNEYLQCRGLTNKLVNRRLPNDLGALTDRLKRLKYLPASSRSYLDNRDNIQVLNNYRFAYTTAADIALKNGNAAEAKQLIETAERKYPPSQLPFFAEATKQWFDQLKKKIADRASLE